MNPETPERPDDASLRREQATRREFLTGEAVRKQAASTAEATARAIAGATGGRGHLVGLSTRAMACDFAVFLPAGPAAPLDAASEALQLIHELEDVMSIYREHSELSRINRSAAESPVTASPWLFSVLERACELSRQTKRAFDPTAGPLTRLWRTCRREGRLPTDEELSDALDRTGVEHVELDEAARTVFFRRKGIGFDLGGIGKGAALDRVAELLQARGCEDWFVHGGHSSILARGVQGQTDGWPVGLRNPLRPDERLATLLLQDRALGTSGAGTQFFRIAGKRYGHIIDPRTGWPVEHLLSVSVLAPSAADADALATAFYVLGVEKSLEYCHNHPRIGAIFIPPPRHGARLAPVVHNIPSDCLTWHQDVLPAGA